MTAPALETAVNAVMIADPSLEGFIGVKNADVRLDIVKVIEAF